METRGHRDFSQPRIIDGQVEPKPGYFDQSPTHVINRASGVIKRAYPKRDKTISARQWRKQRNAARRATKGGK